MKPGQPQQGGKGNFVICEICDGYIRDLEQLRNHMQWIHKVKIHPKMIYNRPPLNCQKCQYRFFTDQGLERHLLGSHGLVTASMQDLANKSQDSGRCPVCGKVFQWKLLNHVAKDHNKVLKPAHLSYKCTVCTATFGQYKLFENHVYTAHSGGQRKGLYKPPPSAGARPTNGQGSAKAPIKVSDEVTIVPTKSATSTSSKPSTPVAKAASKSDDVIALSDDDGEIEEIDEEMKESPSEKTAPKRPAATASPVTAKSRPASDGPEEKRSKGGETSSVPLAFPKLPLPPGMEKLAAPAPIDDDEEGVEEIQDGDSD